MQISKRIIHNAVLGRIEKTKFNSLTQLRIRHLSVIVEDTHAALVQETPTSQSFGAAYFRYSRSVEIRRAMSFLFWNCCPWFRATLGTLSFVSFLTIFEEIHVNRQRLASCGAPGRACLKPLTVMACR
jgi:hypothetical protein